jgi:hypothetical protein
MVQTNGVHLKVTFVHSILTSHNAREIVGTEGDTAETNANLLTTNIYPYVFTSSLLL